MILLALHLGALAAPAPPALVYNFDLSYTDALPATQRFEHVHTVAALGGIVNTDHPQLFTPLLVPGAPNGGVDVQGPRSNTSADAADAVWRDYLSKKGGWLERTAWKNVSSLSELATIFAAELSAGVVLYDPAVPATSSLASTAAGVELLLPVCFRPGVAVHKDPCCDFVMCIPTVHPYVIQGSVYEALVGGGPRLRVALNLR